MYEHRTATARACSNIAFIKYWGNRDDNLRLPANSSFSMNLSGLHTETTVAWEPDIRDDLLTLNGQPETGKTLHRVSRFLSLLREHTGISGRAKVDSTNNFPMGTGIASSASAFAALTRAAVAAAGLDLPERELTTLARLGSGSAARSIPAGFVEWHTAETHAASFAESIAPPDHWDLMDVIAIVRQEHKAVESTQGHQSANSSDLQAARVHGAPERLATCKQALIDRDFSTFADIVEHDSNLMHAVMISSRPPLFYWMPTTLTVITHVRLWRSDGLRVCYTLDAGPNVHCICIRSDAQQVRTELQRLSGIKDIRIAEPGGPACLIKPSIP